MSEEDKSQRLRNPQRKNPKTSEKRVMFLSRKKQHLRQFWLDDYQCIHASSRCLQIWLNLSWIFSNAHMYRFGEDVEGVHDAGLQL